MTLVQIASGSEKLGVIAYSPLGGGLLTGKYGTSERPQGGRLVDDPRYVNRYSLETDFATADRFTEFAQKLDVKPATLAVAWTMSHPDVTAAIIGARNLTQLEDSLAALDVDMTNDLREEISVAPPPAMRTSRSPAASRAWSCKFNSCVGLDRSQSFRDLGLLTVANL